MLLKKNRFSFLVGFTFFLFGVCLNGHAITLPQHDAVPGGIAIVPLPKRIIDRPSAYFNNQQVMVVKNKSEWVAIVGIPLSEPEGIAKIVVKRQSQIIDTQNFNIGHKKYETQFITIKDKRKVEPLDIDMKRIGLEKKRMNKAFNNWTNTPMQRLAFSLPVEGEISSPFGKRRVFNGKPRKPHSGLDIAAPRGTPVKTPMNGKVSEMGDFFFNGKTVLIDHGQGLVTLYCHLDKISVKKGQSLVQGDLIGKVGSTGRATGPHLHWSVSLNNARIAPKLMLIQAPD